MVTTDAKIAKDYDRRNVRLSLDTTAIRQNQFNLYRGDYKDNYPELSNYVFCPEVIATYFQFGHQHWVSEYNTVSQTTTFELVDGPFNPFECDYQS